MLKNSKDTRGSSNANDKKMFFVIGYILSSSKMFEGPCFYDRDNCTILSIVPKRAATPITKMASGCEIVTISEIEYLT